LFTTKHNVLTPPLIDSIVSYAQDKLFDAKVGSGPTNEMLDKKVRNVSHCWLPFEDFDWLYRVLETEIRDVNWINFKFNLNRMEAVDYLEYHAGTDDDPDHSHGKYVAHVDGSVNSTRKLSFSVLLSDPSEFDGGDLLIYDSHTPYTAEKRKGTITFFPSNCLHEVKPVTRGVRRSIVSWVHGPQFC
jgi:PKHD-type hydroxylase